MGVVAITSMNVTLVIPIEPRPAERPRLSRFRTFNTKSYSSYLSALRWKMKQMSIGMNPIGDAISISIKFMVTKPKKPTHHYPSKCDLSNLIKAVEDAGNGILWVDDRQITKISATKEYGDPRIELSIFSQT